MTDLVQRLREMSSDTIGHDAADRIEQLERENAELESKLAKAEHDLFHAGMKSQDNPDDYVMQY